MAPPRILLLAGSTAPAASASLLAAAFARELAFLDVEATRIALSDYPLPLFDADGARAAPLPVKQLGALIDSHQAVFLSAPSLHGGVPALFRNMIEWLAAREEPRRRPPPFALAATAEDEEGAGAALADLRGLVATGLGATIVGGGLAVGRAGLAFDGKGGLDDPRLAVALQKLARELARAGRALAAEP